MGPRQIRQKQQPPYWITQGIQDVFPFCFIFVPHTSPFFLPRILLSNLISLSPGSFSIPVYFSAIKVSPFFLSRLFALLFIVRTLPVSYLPFFSSILFLSAYFFYLYDEFSSWYEVWRISRRVWSLQPFPPIRSSHTRGISACPYCTPASLAPDVISLSSLP